MQVQYGILGPLEVHRDGEAVQVAGERRRALLARLIVAHGRAVPVDTLIDDLWAGSPPAAADATLQSHVSALRRIVGAERIERVGRSYRLPIAHDELDATRAADDVAAARLRLELGDHAEAIGVVERALGRWRGAALADVADQPWALAEVATLDELRAQCLETSLDAYMAAGRTDAVVALGEAAVADHPLRERLWAHLIVGLYRAGRQADAVRTYQRLRQSLQDVGLDPSPDLVALEHAVLRQDPSLTPPAPSSPGAFFGPRVRHGDLVTADLASNGAIWPQTGATDSEGAAPTNGAMPPAPSEPPAAGPTREPRARSRSAVVGVPVVVLLGLVAAAWLISSTSSGSPGAGQEERLAGPAPTGQASDDGPASAGATEAPASDVPPFTRAVTPRFVPPGSSSNDSWLQLEGRLNDGGQLCTRFVTATGPRPEGCGQRPTEDSFGQRGVLRSVETGGRYVSVVAVFPGAARVVATTPDGRTVEEATMLRAPAIGVVYAVLHVDRSEPRRLTAYDAQGRAIGATDLPALPPGRN